MFAFVFFLYIRNVDTETNELINPAAWFPALHAYVSINNIVQLQLRSVNVSKSLCDAKYLQEC